MNSDVHPVVAGLVLLMTAIAVALWAWASGMAAGFGGPAELKTGPGGHHYIGIQNYLVEHDEQGAYLQTHNLEAIGVEKLLGGYAFFSDGDVLLRRGPDPRSFTDNLRAYKREANRNSIKPNEPGSGLFRCDLDTSDCTRFGDDGIDLKAAFSVFIDWQTDDVYISDTTRHLLRKYSSDGFEQASPAGGFRFPNQLMLHDGKLLVADTNNHVIRILEPDTANFAGLVDSRSVVPGVAKSAQQIWPGHFARVGDQWWVNNMQGGMNRGGIYVFDDDWQYIRRVELPPKADPIAILPVGDEVWISDWNNDVVRRFSANGEALTHLESAGLDVILAGARQERRRYTILSFSGVALLVFVLLALLVRSFALTMNRRPGQRSAVRESVTPGDTGEPVFLEPDDKRRKQMSMVLRLVLVVAVIGGAPLVYSFWKLDNPELALPLFGAMAGLFAILLLIAWVNRANWGTSVMLDGQTLTLHDYTGRKSSCSLRQVRFDDTAIATRDAVVILGRPQVQIYNREDVQERLIPRLGNAQRVGGIEMLRIQIQLRHPQGLVAVLAFVGILAYGVVAIAL